MCQRHNFVNKPIHKIEIDMDMWEEYENQGDMAISLGPTCWNWKISSLYSINVAILFLLIFATYIKGFQ